MYGCCRLSEAIMSVAARLLLLTLIIYIDDSILLEAWNCLPSSEALLDLLFDLLRVRMSTAKTESHVSQRVMTVLGINYDRANLSMTITVPVDKLAKALKWIEEAQTGIDDSNLQMVTLEKIRGIIQHFACIKEYKSEMGVVRALDEWTSATKFRKLIMQRPARRKLMTTLLMLKEIIANWGPLVITPAKLDKQMAHVYSDAANPHKPSMGGMLVNEEGKSIAWMLHLPDPSSVPNWAQQFLHIGVWELIAIHVSQRRFREETKDKWGVFHVDNLGDCYCLSAGSSKCVLSQAIIWMITDEVKHSGDPAYYAYIRTSRNLGDPLTRLEKLPALLKEYPAEVANIKPDAIPWSEYKGKFDTIANTRIARPAKKARIHKPDHK